MKAVGHIHRQLVLRVCFAIEFLVDVNLAGLANPELAERVAVHDVQGDLVVRFQICIGHGHRQYYGPRQCILVHRSAVRLVAEHRRAIVLIYDGNHHRRCRRSLQEIPIESGNIKSISLLFFSIEAYNGRDDPGMRIDRKEAYQCRDLLS